MADGRPRNYLWEANKLAKQHGLYIVKCDERIDRSQPWSPENIVPAYIVYRAGASRGQRLGRRKDPAALLAFVKTAAGIA